MQSCFKNSLLEGKYTLIFLFAVLFFLLLNIWPLMEIASGQQAYNLRRFLAVAIVLLAQASLLFIPVWRRSWSDQLASWPLGVRLGLFSFIVLGIISSSLAPMPRYALLQVGFYVGLFNLTILVACWRRQYKAQFDKWVLTLLVTMIAGYCLLVFMAHLEVYFSSGAKEIYTTDSERRFLAAPFFSNIRFLNQYMAWTFPVMVYMCIWPRSMRLKCVNWIVVALFGSLFFATQSHAIMLEVGIIFLIALLGCRYLRTLDWIKAFVVISILSAVLFYLFFCLNAQHLSKLRPLTASGRWQIWHWAWVLIQHHPWLGVGPMHYAYYIVNRSFSVSHCHNIIINLACEWGLLATGILLVVVAWAVVRWCAYIKAGLADEQRVPLKVVIGFCLLGGFINSLFSGTFVMPLSQITACLFIGWAIGMASSPAKSKQLVAGNVSVVIITVLFSVLLVGYGVFPTAFKLQERERAYYQYRHSLHQDYLWHPHFWLQGYLQYKRYYGCD